MGLDSVELVMDVEEAFDVRLPDRDLEKAVTIGKLHALIRREREAAGHPPMPEAESWQILCECVIELAPEVKASDLTPDTHFEKDLRFDG